jgi:hypothetical protein
MIVNNQIMPNLCDILIEKYKIWYEWVHEVKLRGFAGIAQIEKISSSWAANPQELYWPQAF